MLSMAMRAKRAITRLMTKTPLYNAPKDPTREQPIWSINRSIGVKRKHTLDGIRTQDEREEGEGEEGNLGIISKRVINTYRL